MIYVTVGTDTHDFSRLVREMDGIACRRKVVMQIGYTRYEPAHAAWFRFEKNRVIDSLYKKADAVVTHAGAGSIIRSLTSGKIPLVVPRLRRFGEHINDHQLDLARGLAQRGKVVLIEDVSRLEHAIGAKRKKGLVRDGRLVTRLEQWLVEYEKEIS